MPYILLHEEEFHRLRAIERSARIESFGLNRALADTMHKSSQKDQLISELVEKNEELLLELATAKSAVKGLVEKIDEDAAFTLVGKVLVNTPEAVLDRI